VALHVSLNREGKLMRSKGKDIAEIFDYAPDDASHNAVKNFKKS
jgi:hypothetical protein